MAANGATEMLLNDLGQRAPQRSTSEIDKYKYSNTPAQRPMVTSYSCTAASPKAYPSSRPGQGSCAAGMKKPSLKGPNPFEQARLAASAARIGACL